MVGLKATTPGDDGISARTTPTPAGAVSTVRERLLQPRRRAVVGNHLAFALTDDAIQVAVCSHFLGRRRLIDVRKVYIPRNFTDLEHRAQFVAGTIDDLYHELGGRWTTVSLTLSGSETAFRGLVLPDLGRKALAQALWFEAKRQLPFPINDCHYDYRRVAAVQDGSTRKTKVALLAATRRLVAEQMAPFLGLHIEIDAVYQAQDVIGRLLAGLPGFDSSRNYCIINIERMRSEIAYYRGCDLEFLHVISLGSNFLANRRDETVFQYFAETLVSEIQNSLDFYSGQNTVSHANQVFIYGDLSYSIDLIGRLSSRFDFTFQKFPVELLKLFEYDAGAMESSLAVCLPVVAAAVNRVALPDLLPPENKAMLRSRRFDRLSYAALAVLAVLIAFIWIQGKSDLSDHQNKLMAVNAEIEQFRTSALYATYDSIKQQMAFDQAYLSRIKPTPSYISGMLKELSTLTPNEIRLYDFGLAKEQPDRNGHLAGVVRSSDTPPEVILAEFVERLHRSPVFSQVTVDSYQKKKDAGVFSLFFQLSFAGKV